MELSRVPEPGDGERFVVQLTRAAADQLALVPGDVVHAWARPEDVRDSTQDQRGRAQRPHQSVAVG